MAKTRYIYTSDKSPENINVLIPETYLPPTYIGVKDKHGKLVNFHLTGK